MPCSVFSIISKMRQMTSPYKALVFDAYGTLFDVASIEGALRQHYPEQAAAIAPIWRQKQLAYTWLRTLMGRYKDFYALTEDALRYALQANDCPEDEARIRPLMAAYYRLSAYPDVKPALGQLKGDYALAILSNANPSLLQRAVLHNDLEFAFDALISADELQAYKPTPAVYGLAAQHLQLPPETILFVSANTWDIAGAKSAGLATAWMDRQAGQAEALGFLPDFTLGGMEELLGVV